MEHRHSYAPGRGKPTTEAEWDELLDYLYGPLDGGAGGHYRTQTHEGR